MQQFIWICTVYYYVNGMQEMRYILFLKLKTKIPWCIQRASHPNLIVFSQKVKAVNGH